MNYKSDKPDLAGSKILITGATSGLGRELATQFALKHGAHVIATGRRNPALDTLLREIESAGGSLTPLQLDVTSFHELEQFSQNKSLADLNGVVLNAGVTSANLFLDGSLKVDQSLIDTNVTANLKLVRHLIPKLMPGGRIQIIASLGGLIPLPYQAVYSGTKAFMVNFGLSLREELRPKGIEVSIVAPGGFASEMTDIDEMAGLRKSLDSAEFVAEESIKAYIENRALTVPGKANKRTAFLARMLPAGALSKKVAGIYRNARR